jgi:hypothetical protein
MLWLNLLFFIDARQGIRRGYPDFTIFYTAGTIVRKGLAHQLYDKSLQFSVQESFTGHIPFRLGPLPYNHPPFESILFVPLSLLPYSQAFMVWNLLNVAALFAIAALLRKSVVSLQSFPLWTGVMCALAFFPVFACLLEGQDSILLLLLCTLAFNALKKKSDVAAGCWLALAAFKFQFVIPLVLFLLLWKRRRVAVGFGATAMGLVLASVALVGSAAMVRYPGYILRIANTPGMGGIPPELLPNLHGLVMGWPGFLGLTGAGLAVAVSAAVFGFAAWKGSSSSRPEKLELQFSMAILVSLLIAWQTNSHDHSLLVLPLVLVADHCLRGVKHAGEIGYSLLLPVVPLLMSPLWMVLWLGIAKVNLMAIPLLWWTWKISEELSRMRSGESGFAS